MPAGVRQLRGEGKEKDANKRRDLVVQPSAHMIVRLGVEESSDVV